MPTGMNYTDRTIIGNGCEYGKSTVCGLSQDMCYSSASDPPFRGGIMYPPSISCHYEEPGTSRELPFHYPVGEMIRKVIFNGDCTIVLWKDQTKTIVRCQEMDDFDPEKGLAMAIVKRICGNTGAYYEIFKDNILEEGEIYG